MPFPGGVTTRIAAHGGDHVHMNMIMQVTHHDEPSLGCYWASVKDAGTIFKHSM